MRSSETLPQLREWILFGILGAMTFALKLGMALLPNIEPVSLCILVYGAVFGYKALYPVFVYVGLEILCFGLGIWNVYYLYVWPLLVVIAIVAILAFRDKVQELWTAISDGINQL